MGLHQVLTLIQLELVYALPRVEKGEAEEVVHRLDCRHVKFLTEVFIEAVPRFHHGLEVCHVFHGIICEPLHRGDVVKVQTIDRVLLPLCLARHPSSPQCEVAMASVSAFFVLGCTGTPSYAGGSRLGRVSATGSLWVGVSL